LAASIAAFTAGSLNRSPGVAGLPCASNVVKAKAVAHAALAVREAAVVITRDRNPWTSVVT
jgi:hypothetical protein